MDIVLSINNFDLNRLRIEATIVKVNALIPINTFDNISKKKPALKPIDSEAINEEVRLIYTIRVITKSGFIFSDMANVFCVKFDACSNIRKNRTNIFNDVLINFYIDFQMNGLNIISSDPLPNIIIGINFIILKVGHDEYMRIDLSEY